MTDDEIKKSAQDIADWYLAQSKTLQTELAIRCQAIMDDVVDQPMQAVKFTSGLQEAMGDRLNFSIDPKTATIQ